MKKVPDDADGCEEHEEKIAQRRIASAHFDLRLPQAIPGPAASARCLPGSCGLITSYCEATS